MVNKVLSKNTIYDKQLACIVFCSAIAFKLSSLPRLLSKSFDSSSFIAMVFLCIFDLLIFYVVYYVISINGYENSLKVFPKTTKFVTFLFLMLLSFKFLFFFSVASFYISSSMFTEIPGNLIVFTLILPILYLAIKGIVPIARTSQILVIFIFIMLALGLIFFNGSVSTNEILPVFTQDFEEFMSNFADFGIWTGDLLPFAFVKLAQNQKRNPLAKVKFSLFTVPLTYILIIIMMFLGVGLYGSSLVTIENLAVSIPIFNEFTKVVGRLEWLGLIPWFLSSVINLSIKLWVLGEIAEPIIKIRKAFYCVFILLIVIVCSCLENFSTVTQFAKNKIVGTTYFVSFAVLTILFLTVSIFAKKKIQKIKMDEMELKVEGKTLAFQSGNSKTNQNADLFYQKADNQNADSTANKNDNSNQNADFTSQNFGNFSTDSTKNKTADFDQNETLCNHNDNINWAFEKNDTFFGNEQDFDISNHTNLSFHSIGGKTVQVTNANDDDSKGDKK